MTKIPIVKQWSPRHRHRASKRYICNECNQPIEKGEWYFSWTWRDKSRPNRPTRRVHSYHRFGIPTMI